jgi:NAD(P)-dependent dehydrogenase (short-subunit alcohol dehydrogenase family)
MDMYGKTTLVTGSTGGIGKETARWLARLGARVLLVQPQQDRAHGDELRTIQTVVAPRE